jgi:hypothetical protein
MHLEKLKKEIEQLSNEEFGQLRRWFAEKELDRLCVAYPNLETAYKEMAQGEKREDETLMRGTEAMTGDISHEAW